MDLKSLKNKLTGKVRNIMSRLSGKTTLPTASGGDDDPALQFAFSDPTQISYPNGGNPSEATNPKFLSELLHGSAGRILDHESNLKRAAKKLAAAIVTLASREVTKAIQSVRFIIVGVWLLTAIWLFFSGTGLLTGNASALSAGMPAEHAAILARTFFNIGLLGLIAPGAIWIFGFIAEATNNGPKNKVDLEARKLGVFIANIANGFDEDLDEKRKQMDIHIHNNPEDAIGDLCGAHLTALEASAFFKRIPFLFGSDDQEAREYFENLLDPGDSSTSSWFEGFVLGTLLGIIIAVMALGPKPEIPVVSALPDIAQYPMAANLLLFGGLIYAFAGIVLSLAGDKMRAFAALSAREHALQALQNAFANQKAPRQMDIVRRVEDARDVFRARVRGLRPDSAHADHQGPGGAHFGEDKADSETPSWRKRDSSAQFVESGFQSAPQTWRADAYAKKFATSDRDKPGSKRGLLGLKKPSSD